MNFQISLSFPKFFVFLRWDKKKQHFLNICLRRCLSEIQVWDCKSRKAIKEGNQEFLLWCMHPEYGIYGIPENSVRLLSLFKSHEPDSITRCVSWSVFQLAFLADFTSLSLPKYLFCLSYHCSRPPICDLDSQVTGLVFAKKKKQPTFLHHERILIASLN